MVLDKFATVKVSVLIIAFFVIAIVTASCETSNGNEMIDPNSSLTPTQTPDQTSDGTQPSTTPTPTITPTPSPLPTSITWVKTWDEALEQAQEQNKPIMINFFTNVCPYCVKLDKNIFQHPETGAFIAQNFVTFKSNASTSRLHANYGINNSVPTTIFAMSDGAEFARIPGYAAVERFQPWLEQILEVWNKKSGT